MKLKNLLPVVFVNQITVRDDDNDLRVIWRGQKNGAGYDVLQRVYNDYDVVSIRTHKDGVLYIDLCKESLL